jgi:putative spermidine/putrescine transport system substrate-binding protein
MVEKDTCRVTRRRALTLGGAALASPWLWARPAAAAGEVLVRTSGGAYEDIMRRAVYEPFRRATGIQVIPVAATTSRLFAMLRARNVELDVVDTGDGVLITLEKMGALAPIAYDRWRFGKPEEITPQLRLPTRVGNFVYSTVLGFRTDAFPNGAHPKSWEQFWDVARFPGRRTLADVASGQTHLEFALLADGVPMDRLYPIDLDRAFRSLSRIRPHVPKFWDTGALSAQMLADREVVAGAIWNGRLQTVIDRGVPLSMEWNQNMIMVQAYSILKDARNAENAQRFVDFAAQASVQAEYSRELRYGPANARAFGLMPRDMLDSLPGGPASRDIGFYQDADWWDVNRERVARTWARWILT